MVTRGRVWRTPGYISSSLSRRPPEGNYALNSRFSLLDLYIAVVSRWAQQDDWRPTHLPKVEKVTGLVAAREACAPVWQRHRPGDQLLDLPHHRRWDPFDRSIDIRISRIRRKIEPGPSKPSVIKTVHGIG